MIREKIVFILYSYHKNISNRKELKLCVKWREASGMILKSQSNKVYCQISDLKRYLQPIFLSFLLNFAAKHLFYHFFISSLIAWFL